MPAITKNRRGQNVVEETWKEITADQPKNVLGIIRSNGFASPHKGGISDHAQKIIRKPTAFSTFARRAGSPAEHPGHQWPLTL
jgi:hypothetical protein